MSVCHAIRMISWHTDARSPGADPAPAPRGDGNAFRPSCTPGRRAASGWEFG